MARDYERDRWGRRYDDDVDGYDRERDYGREDEGDVRMRGWRGSEPGHLHYRPEHREMGRERYARDDERGRGRRRARRVARRLPRPRAARVPALGRPHPR